MHSTSLNHMIKLQDSIYMYDCHNSSQLTVRLHVIVERIYKYKYFIELIFKTEPRLKYNYSS